jgi:CysZ protein
MFVSDFIHGIRSYGKALSLIAELKLWKYFFIPALIGFLVGALILTLAFAGADNIGLWLTSLWPFEWGESVINGIANFLGGLIIIAIGLVIYKHVVMALSAPFMAPISEKIEIHLTGRKLNETNTASEYIRTLVRGIKINIRNLLIELLITLPLLILSFIPGINIFSTLLIFYVQSYFSGYGNMDYTLERHLNYNLTKSFVRKNKGVAAGNGFLFTLMLFIPVLGMMLTLPISTAAATVETIRKLEQQKKLVQS